MPFQLLFLNKETNEIIPFNNDSGLTLYKCKESPQLRKDILCYIHNYTTETVGIFRKNKKYFETLKAISLMDKHCDLNSEKDMVSIECWIEKLGEIAQHECDKDIDIDTIIAHFNNEVANDGSELQLIEHIDFFDIVD